MVIYAFTIQKILSSQVYIGNTVQGKSEKLSYKGEERRYKPQSEWDIVENTHDAIFSYDTWHKEVSLFFNNFCFFIADSIDFKID